LNAARQTSNSAVNAIKTAFTGSIGDIKPPLLCNGGYRLEITIFLGVPFGKEEQFSGKAPPAE